MAKKPSYEELEQRVKELEKEALKHKRAEQEAQRRAAQLELIYEVGQSVSGELELEALFSKIVGTVRDAFDYHNVMLELVDEEAKCMDVQSVAGAYADFFPYQHMTVGEGMTGYAAATGETQVSGDVIQDPHYVPDVEETKSELAVPIKSGQEVIGVLDIQSDEFDAFDETDVMVMETLADQVAVAIKNARLYETVQQELTERKQAEEALRERGEFNKALFEFNPIETVVVDLEGRVTSINLAKKNSGDRLPNIGDVMYKDYAGKHETDMYAELMKCIRSGKTRRFPERKYGNKLLSITVSPFYKGAIITSEDITERKQAEEALQHERDKLQDALDKVKTLSGMLPICANCKKIRDDKGYWNQIESYIAKHSEVDFSHSICPECAKKLYPEFYKGD